MADQRLKVGQIFAVPLGRGRFAHGYVTYAGEGFGFPMADVVAGVSNSSTPPEDMAERPVALANLWIALSNFRRFSFQRNPWFLTHSVMTRPCRPTVRGVLFGFPGSYRRQELAPDAKPMPISDEDARGLEPQEILHIDEATERIAAAVGVELRRRSRPERPPRPSRVSKTADEDELLVIKHASGSHSLSFAVPGRLLATFEKLGRLGNGYDWAQVVQVLVREDAPSIARKLKYDPEADTFSVSSKDKAAIKQVAELVRNALKNRKVLVAAIGESEED